MNKKGWEVMHSVILFLIIIIVIFTYIQRIGKSYDTMQDVYTCRESVNANTRLKLTGEEFSSNLVCPTRQHTITEENDELVKKELAGYMDQCWKSFKSGEKELFSNDWYFCVVCDTISFEDKDRGDIKNFTGFIAETPVDGDMTYAESFHKSTEDVDYLKEELPNGGETVKEIDPKKDYMVIFHYIKGADRMTEYFNQDIEEKDDSGSVIGVGLVAGSLIAGSIVAVPMLLVGSIFILADFLEEAEPQWAAYVELREFSPVVLNKCDYLPAKQR